MGKFIFLFILLLLAQHNFAHWQQSAGTATKTIHGLGINGSHIFSGTNYGVWQSTDNGASSYSSTTGIGNYVGRAFANVGTYVFAGCIPGVFLSTDYGANWTLKNSGITNGFTLSMFEHATDVYAGTSNGGIFKSADIGNTWTEMNTGLTDLNVWSFTALGSDIYTGSASGVFKSSNGGSNWLAVNNWLPVSTVYALAVNGSDILAGTSGSGIFKSSDNGASWTAINNGLTNLDVRALKQWANVIYAGTFGGGVFLSTNDGASWTAINSGLTTDSDLKINALEANGSTLFAGTLDGLWYRPLSEINAIDKVSHNNIQLSAFPNPFKKQTTINYSLAKTENISLIVYNITGDMVKPLLNETQSPGSYQVNMNATDLSAGIYFCHLITPGETKIIKLFIEK